MSPQFFLTTKNILPFSENGMVRLFPESLSGHAINGQQQELDIGNEGNSGASASANDQFWKSSRSSNAFAVIEIGECLLRYLEDLNATQPSTHLLADLFEAFPILSRLAKALSEAGIEPKKLSGCSAENAVRLVIVASLFDLRISPPKILEKKSSTPAMQKWRLIRVLKYIDASLSERLSLIDLATVAGISRMYFAGQFRAATGLRPHDYVQRRRIEHAQQLLRMSDLPLREIAQSVGFQSQSHFTTTFKRFIGATPYRWRQEQNAS